MDERLGHRACLLLLVVCREGAGRAALLEEVDKLVEEQTPPGRSPRVVVLVPDGEVAPMGHGIDTEGVEEVVLDRAAVDADVAEVATTHALQHGAGVRVWRSAKLAIGWSAGAAAGEAEGAAHRAVRDRRPQGAAFGAAHGSLRARKTAGPCQPVHLLTAGGAT